MARKATEKLAHSKIARTKGKTVHKATLTRTKSVSGHHFTVTSKSGELSGENPVKRRRVFRFHYPGVKASRLMKDVQMGRVFA